MQIPANRRVVRSEVVFDTPRLRVRQDRVAGDEEPFWVVERPSGVVIYCTTTSNDLLLVRQYRHAARRWSLELPQGALEPNESPVTAAMRELFEETGWTGGDGEIINPLIFEAADWATPSFAVVKLRATVCIGAGEEGVATVPTSPAELPALIASGAIVDAATLAALYVVAIG